MSDPFHVQNVATNYLSLQALDPMGAMDDTDKVMVIAKPDAPSPADGVGSVGIPALKAFLLEGVWNRLTDLENKPGNGGFVQPITLTIDGAVSGSGSFDGSSDFTINVNMGANVIAISSVTNLSSTLQSLQDQIDEGTSGAAYYASVDTTIGAGAGLVGGGTLGANRVISLGVPSRVDGTSTNTADAGTHTHELHVTAADVVGLGSLATQDGEFSGKSSGTNTGDQTDIPGNAATASALQISRTINGVPFDGTQDIVLPTTDGNVTRYEHVQIAAAALWVVVHNLNAFPSFVAVDSAGTEVGGVVSYIDRNTLHYTFSGAMAGKGYAN